MRNEVSETYITHPCSSGFATWVAATRIQTQNPNTCKRKAQAKGLHGLVGVRFPLQVVLRPWLNILHTELGGNQEGNGEGRLALEVRVNFVRKFKWSTQRVPMEGLG